MSDHTIAVLIKQIITKSEILIEIIYRDLLTNNGQYISELHQHFENYKVLLQKFYVHSDVDPLPMNILQYSEPEIISQLKIDAISLMDELIKSKQLYHDNVRRLCNENHEKLSDDNASNFISELASRYESNEKFFLKERVRSETKFFITLVDEMIL